MKTEMDMTLAELVSLSLLREVAERYSELTELPILVVGPDGEPIVGTIDPLLFCRRFSPAGSEERPCLSCGRALPAVDGPADDGDGVFLCPTHLLDLAYPIIVETRCLGHIVTGQVALEPAVRGEAERILISSGVEPETAHYIAHGVVDMPRERIAAIGGFLQTIVRAIAELAVANHRVKEKSIRDSLTGLLNHAYLVERIGEELSHSARSGKPLALVMLDLDRFKEINDSYGHLMGDALLCQVSLALRSVSRSSDSIGRLGGDEFCLLLPDTGLTEAEMVAQRLHRAICGVAISDGKKEFSVTPSIGVACSRGVSYETPESLMERADRQLYRSKAAGRNRVSVAHESHTEG